LIFLTEISLGGKNAFDEHSLKNKHGGSNEKRGPRGRKFIVA
jgi:hypothetical protein